jgi:hypothetical protein
VILPPREVRLRELSRQAQATRDMSRIFSLRHEFRKESMHNRNRAYRSF